MPFTPEEAAEQSAILADLRALGYDFSSLSAFAQAGIRYKDAVPMLLEWLRKARTPMMQRAVARTLTNPSAKGAAMPALVDAFRNFTDEADTRSVLPQPRKIERTFGNDFITKLAKVCASAPGGSRATPSGAAQAPADFTSAPQQELPELRGST
ncbi:hypothetical protein [Curtobacterium flaccumfaciens]|uniref:hypothetical protein n=1 Tax=Curtobacterium flaccumfaciens TaxID=2035 RepID=UPI00217E40AF|nr:hypothetical protein [Curtobacterium flaccumfaciens]MCS6588091.1 hypothetical protein [Curtobacterium flaccumfaciens pv. flaccumfaciens]